MCDELRRESQTLRDLSLWCIERQERHLARIGGEVERRRQVPAFNTTDISRLEDALDLVTQRSRRKDPSNN